jgi:triacylglycerol esterase/lipase EstA (alpha/beta hydrolase family)
MHAYRRIRPLDQMEARMTIDARSTTVTGNTRLWTLLLFAVVVLSTAFIVLPVPPARADDAGPPLQESPEALAQALSCPASFQHKHEPVLLVHGTASTGERNWSTNYGRVLPALGYDVCTVDLVDLGRGDIQASAERIVYAIRTLAKRSHSKVEVIGHSEGPLPVRWAIKWWPDIRFLVDDLIGIAAPYHGWLGTEVFCAGGCVPALWQMRRESQFMAAQNSGDETPGDISYTSVYTINDELVQPYSTADLQGGSNIAIQEVCPGRVGEHYEMLYDAAAYGVVLDALTHLGPASLSRVDRSLCLQLTMPGTMPADLVAAEVDAWTFAVPALNEHHVDGEPPLADYARS